MSQKFYIVRIIYDIICVSRTLYFFWGISRTLYWDTYIYEHAIYILFVTKVISGPK